MLNIKTNIGDCDVFLTEDIFDAIVGKAGVLDNAEVVSIIKEIDSAEYIGNNKIKTPFGVTDIDGLSSGCRAAIVAWYFGKNNIKKRISLVSCDKNSVRKIFELGRNYDIYIAFSSYVLDAPDVQYVVDGQAVFGISEYNSYIAGL